jgi:hypothetical protein
MNGKRLDLTALRARCAGAVVGPGDLGYLAACLACGVRPAQRPAAIGFPEDAADVECMVAAAREAGLAVAAVAARGDLSRALLLGPAADGYAAA